MNVKIYKEVEVIRPSVQGLESDILDHFPLHTNDRFGLRNDEGLWISYNEMGANHNLGLCADGEMVYQNGQWIGSHVFVVQAGVQCKAVGLDAEDQKSEVARVYGEIEGREIEKALLASVFTSPVALPASGVASAVAVQVALAQLEGYMAQHYAGRPTIHMPRAAMSLLGLRVKWQGDQAFTELGSRIVAGGGYDSGTGGQYDMYATGEVYIEATEEIDIQSYVVPGDGSVTQGINDGDNTVLTVAERLYRVAFDGPLAKATAAVF